jgi:hypothetical protein
VKVGLNSYPIRALQADKCRHKEERPGRRACAGGCAERAERTCRGDEKGKAAEALQAAIRCQEALHHTPQDEGGQPRWQAEEQQEDGEGPAILHTREA